MPNTIEALKPIADYTDGGGHWTNYFVPNVDDGDDVLVCYLDGRPYFRQTLVAERFDRSHLAQSDPETYGPDMWADFGVNGHSCVMDTDGTYVEIDGELLLIGEGDYFESSAHFLAGMPVETRSGQTGHVVEVHDDGLAVVVEREDGNRFSTLVPNVLIVGA